MIYYYTLGTWASAAINPVKYGVDFLITHDSKSRGIQLTVKELVMEIFTWAHRDYKLNLEINL